MKLRTSSSIVNFQEKAEKALGLERYDWRTDDQYVPVVFLGLYHKGDFKSFMRPRVKRFVLWSGGDIQNFKRGYLYGDGEGLWKSIITSPFFGRWRKKIIKTEAEHFCENELQKEELVMLGIKAEVVPAFWGNIDDFPISFKPSIPTKVYISGHPKREKEYGFEVVKNLAEVLRGVEFHIYGAYLKPNSSNIYNHGIVPESQFNEEIKNYHCLLRLNLHDGFGDCLAKSVLSGQYPISSIEYPNIQSFKSARELIFLINDLANKKEPNLKAREYWLHKINKYPFIR